MLLRQQMIKRMHSPRGANDIGQNYQLNSDWLSIIFKNDS